MANAPLPQRQLPVLDQNGNFILTWYRWLQNLTTASGPEGPQGATGARGPAGKDGASGTNLTAYLAISSLNKLSNVGTVSSVALTAPAEFNVAGSPIVGSGTFVLSKANETANTVWAGPTSGGAAQPTFRSLVTADIPGGFPAVTARTTFAPTVTFATPGDLSVVYVTQTGAYVRVGPMVLFWYDLVFSPTYTTALGLFEVSLPPVAPTDQKWAWPVSTFNHPAWTGSPDTMIVAVNGASSIQIQGLDSASSANQFTVAQIVSGVQYTLIFSGYYF